MSDMIWSKNFHCCVCGRPISGIYAKPYCTNCLPDIIFKLKVVNGLLVSEFQIKIPKGHELRMSWDRFYELITEKLDMHRNRILLYGKFQDSCVMNPLNYGAADRDFVCFISRPDSFHQLTTSVRP